MPCGGGNAPPERKRGLAKRPGKTSRLHGRPVDGHLQDLFEDRDLDPEATLRKFRIVRREGTHIFLYISLAHMPARERKAP